MDRIEKQLDLFADTRDEFIIDKPIRLIEFFAGIGAQHKALSQLTDKVESYKICEWAYNSYCSYNAIHLKDKTDYSAGLTKQQLIEKVRGTSLNYNEPLNDSQLNKRSLEWLKNAYNNIIATHNLVNIMNVKGKDLEIVEKDRYTYILTYSFPCQDLSLAGKRAGMSTSQADGGTRSGLLWEVERILGELGKDDLPQVLVMENVPEVVGTANIKDFQKWEKRLTDFGYTNFIEILNAKDYGIPQNRRRCFMVSILGNYHYEHPAKLKLKYLLKDFLEKNVDEKYYLSKKMIDCFMSSGTGAYPRRERFLSNINRENKDIGNSVTTLAGNRPTDNFVVEKFGNKALDETLEENEVEDNDFIDAYNRSVKKDIAGTITTRVSDSNGTFIAKEVDCVGNYGNGFHSQNVYNPNGVSPTITTGNHGLGTAIVEKDDDQTLKEQLCNELIINGLVEEGDIIKHSYAGQIISGKKKCVEKSNEMITLTTRGDCVGVCVNEYYGVYDHKESDTFRPTLEKRIHKDYPMSKTLTTREDSCCVIERERESNLRIRKLTPKECMRLMGFQDDDYEAMKEIGMSDSAIYHCAGDSIVVSVLMGIFSQMINGIDNHKKPIEEYVEKIFNIT